MRGVVKWYSWHRKFGFLLSNENKETFFHINDWPPGSSPEEGIAVEYESGQDKSGRPKAVKIVCVGVVANEKFR